MTFFLAMIRLLYLLKFKYFKNLTLFVKLWILDNEHITQNKLSLLYFVFKVIYNIKLIDNTSNYLSEIIYEYF